MIKIEQLVGKVINGLAFLAPSIAGKIMIDLFCRPKEGKKFTKKEQVFLNKAKWVALQYKGHKIQHYNWGNGYKKVLLAHGFNSNASRWRPLVNLLLQAGYQVVAFDAPAHGNSEWQRVNGLLYAQVLGVTIAHFKPDFIIGHSFAGMAIAYYFSKMQALPIEKIVLMGVPNELMDVTKVFFNTLGINQTGQLAYFKSFEEKFGYKVNYFTLSYLLKSLSYPGLIIHDENDKIASFEGAKVLHNSWDNSHFFATQKLGHSLQGSAVYKTIIKFIDQ